MKTFRQLSSPLRVLLAALLMLGWVVAGNHCALGLMPAVASAAGCPGCQAPSSHPQPAPSGMQECCKVPRGLPADTAKVAVQYDTALFTLLDFAVVEVLTADDAARPRAAAGPPEVRSFSELVLQRSLRSHAPPTRA